MIQRIQSIFLLLAACSFGALFKLPLITSGLSTARFLADKVYSIQDHLLLLSITVFAAGTSVLAIFLYKNRKLQRQLANLVILLAVGLGISSYILLKIDTGEALRTTGIQVAPGLLLPVAGIVFCLLAGYFISKDEKLVKSMDRLR